MKKIKLSRKLLLDYLFVFILVIYAGKATVFVRSLESWENILGLILPIIFTLYLAYVKRVKFSKGFYFLFIGFFAYFVLSSIKFNQIHPRFFGIYLINFYIAYVAIRSFKMRFFIYYENVIYFLCIISLLFWVVNFLVPSQLASFLRVVSFSEPGAPNVESNIIFYTLNVQNEDSLAFSRNAGFAWEPGAFSVFINFAIFINLAINRFKLKGNKKILIFIIALLTTFSTTGYGIFMLLVLFYVYNHNIKYRVFLFPIAILLGFYLMSLPFMSEKLIDVSKESTDELLENSILYDKQYSPQRITSFMIDFQDFMNNPILGYGGHQEERWTNKLGADISSISGIGKILAKFGIIGTVFFFIGLFYSSKFLKSNFRFKGWLFPFLLILLTSVSYSLIEDPLFMCFWLVVLFYPKTKFKKSYSVVMVKN